MKKIIIGLLIIVLVAVGLTWRNPTSVNIKTVDDQNADLIIFWGEGCPHCENVKNYIKQNSIDQKLKISLDEVYYNKTNQLKMAEIAKKCPEIDTSKGMGVPLTYVVSENKCLSGDVPVIDWIKNKLNIQ